MSSNDHGVHGGMDALAEKWEIAPLRRFLRGIDQGWSPSAEDRRTEPEEWAVLKLSAVSRGTFRPEEHKALPADLNPIHRLEVHAGDLLLTRANTPELVGDVCVVPEVRPKLMMSDLIYRLRLDTSRLQPRFAQYWLLSAAGREQIARDARGTSQSMVKISQQTVRTWLIPVPPLDEQSAIADFLDEKTTAIDELIADKLRMIELLHEERQILIREVIARGVNPCVATRESGVEWIGKMPAHWEVSPLKYQVRFINGAAFKPSDWKDEGTPIIRIENLNGGENFNHSTDRLDPKYHVREGDLLFGWSGNRGTSFGPFIWSRPGQYYLNQHIFRLADYACNKRWFYWALKAMTAYVEKRAHGIIGMVHITKQDLGDIRFPVIPECEQNAIAEHLDRRTARLDDLISDAQQAIELLREYRQSLVSEVITGKLAVREEAFA